MITSYAQNFEDVMLWRALGHIENGFYIDVGAHDPLVDSVSLAFYERGWRGINVEPLPYYANALRQSREGDIVIESAAGDGESIVRFFEIPHTGISTADEVIASQHRERGFEVREITVPCVPLNQIFELRGGNPIHWLKIDVEGFEKSVLSSWRASPARPWIVVVESTIPLTQTQNYESWDFILVGYGYKCVYFDGLNRYYISVEHPELESAFNSPPNVFDGFKLNGTASATFHHLIDVRFSQRIAVLRSQLDQQEDAAKSEAERIANEAAQFAKDVAERNTAYEAREQSRHQQLIDLTEEFRLLEQKKGEREQSLAQRNEDARREIDELLRKIAQREQEFSAQFLRTREREQDDKSEQARAHWQHVDSLREERIKIEQRYVADLQEAREELRRTEQDFFQREKLFGKASEDARSAMNDVVQATKEREAERIQRFAAFEAAVEQKRNEQIQAHGAYTALLKGEFAERESKFNDELAKLRGELRQLQAELVERDRVIEKGAADKREEIDELLRAMAEVEQKRNDQIQAHTAHTSALKGEFTERQSRFNDELAKLRGELRRFEAELVERDRAVEKGAADKREEIDELLRAMAEVEQKRNDQIQAHTGHASVLKGEFAERESKFNDELAKLRGELRQLEGELVERGRAIEKGAADKRDVIDRLLRSMAERERDVISQLQAIQRQAEQDKSALTTANLAEMGSVRLSFEERERQFNQEMAEVRSRTLLLEQERLRREQDHAAHVDEVGHQVNLALALLADWDRKLGDSTAQADAPLEDNTADPAQHHLDVLVANARDYSLRKGAAHGKSEKQRESLERLGLFQSLVAARVNVAREREVLLQKQIDDINREARNLVFSNNWSSGIDADRIIPTTELLQYFARSANHLRTSLLDQIDAGKAEKSTLESALAEMQRELTECKSTIWWRLTSRMTYRRVPASHRTEKAEFINAALGQENPATTASAAQSTNNILIATDTSSMSLTTRSIDSRATSAPMTVDELLERFDADFVHHAYKALLHREPDPEGFVYYLRRVRGGVPKLEILTQLKSSDEGAKIAPSIAGLDKAIAQFRKRRSGLVNVLKRLILRESRFDSVERHLSAFENRFAVFDIRCSERFVHIERGIAQLQEVAVQHTQLVLDAVASQRVQAATPQVLEATTVPLTLPIEAKNLTLASQQIFRDLKTAIVNKSKSQDHH